MQRTVSERVSWSLLVDVLTELMLSLSSELLRLSIPSRRCIGGSATLSSDEGVRPQGWKLTAGINPSPTLTTFLGNTTEIDNLGEARSRSDLSRQLRALCQPRSLDSLPVGVLGVFTDKTVVFIRHLSLSPAMRKDGIGRRIEVLD